MSNLPGGWPAWVALVLAALVGINELIKQSSTLANFLGGWARKIHARAAAGRQVDIASAEFTKFVADAVENAREKWEGDENEALASLSTRLETVRSVTAEQALNIAELQFQVRCMTAYTEYEAWWHHQLDTRKARAAESLLVEDILDHMLYYEFEQKCRDQSMKWRTWAPGVPPPSSPRIPVNRDEKP